ncbi:hypothetical protein C7271_08685 [filamentous cyanobacterium CCP5]|nr:hypothetical protein C7271_08685 [filamentous cyanobacterium CCP5]
MARYTNLFSSISSVPAIKDSLVTTLKSCDLTMVYEARDYIMAKEKPGQVSFSQLATIEVLINPPTASKTDVTVNLVVHNEELPLSMNNHCQKVFETVNQAVTASI